MCCLVTPRTSILLVRLRSPLRILTADFGVFKSCARNSMSASLARPSTAGACRRILMAPPISPATSSLEARGCTRTAKTRPPPPFSVISIKRRCKKAIPQLCETCLNWSGRWESNPRPKLGKLLYCHCTTPALLTGLSIIQPRECPCSAEISGWLVANYFSLDGATRR